MKPDLVQYFLVQAGKYSYYVVITTKYGFRTNKPISYFVDVGGTMKGCVRVLIEKPDEIRREDERFRNFEQQKEIATIQWIGFNKKCSVRNDLLNGEGTRHMVRVAMTIVINAFNWITKFKLTDASRVKCIEGLEMSLANLSFVTNGKSYYEKYLRAYLQHEEYRTKYGEASKVLSDPYKKLPIQDFGDLFPIDKFTQGIYERSTTYLEFFNNLKDECKKADKVFCEVVHSWLDSFVRFILGSFNLENVWMADWIIDKETVKQIPVSEWTEEWNATEIEKVMQEEFQDYIVQKGGKKNASFLLGDLD